MALWSAEGIGPVTRPCTAGRAANACASAFALFRSAAVSPEGRTYTTTAGLRFFDTNLACAFSSWVDSALAGRYADGSFFSAPISLLDSGPATATTTSQNTRTSHLVLLPHGSAAIRLPLLGAGLDTASRAATRPPRKKLACVWSFREHTMYRVAGSCQVISRLSPVPRCGGMRDSGPRGVRRASMFGCAC